MSWARSRSLTSLHSTATRCRPASWTGDGMCCPEEDRRDRWQSGGRRPPQNSNANACSTNCAAKTGLKRYSSLPQALEPVPPTRPAPKVLFGRNIT
jgi:hypothetical protein